MKRIMIKSGILVVLVISIFIYVFARHVPIHSNIQSILKDDGYTFVRETSEGKSPSAYYNYDSKKSYFFNEFDAISVFIYSNCYDPKTEIQLWTGPTSEMFWFGTPTFFWKDRFIVVYSGRDEKIISDLEKILGKQYRGDSKQNKIWDTPPPYPYKLSKGS